MVTITNVSNNGTINNKVAGLQNKINNTRNNNTNTSIVKVVNKLPKKTMIYRGINVVAALTMAASAYYMQTKAYQSVGNQENKHRALYHSIHVISLLYDTVMKVGKESKFIPPLLSAITLYTAQVLKRLTSGQTMRKRNFLIPTKSEVLAIAGTAMTVRPGSLTAMGANFSMRQVKGFAALPFAQFHTQMCGYNVSMDGKIGLYILALLKQIIDRCTYLVYLFSAGLAVSNGTSALSLTEQGKEAINAMKSRVGMTNKQTIKNK